MSASTYLTRAAISNALAPPAPDVPPLQRRSHRRTGRLLSLLLCVAVPTGLFAGYLYSYAEDQYVSEFRFSVRHQAPLRTDPTGGSASGGLALGPAANLAMITDSQAVVQYLKSRQVIDDVAAAGIDLDALYARDGGDIIAHLRPGAPAEERQRYWRRMVDPFFDMTSGIVSVQVHAFRPEDAQRLAATVLRLAEALVNDMSRRAHADQLAYAEKAASESADRLRRVQADLAAFRSQHAVLFPEMDANAGNQVEGKIEESLIEAKTALRAQLAQGAAPDSRLMINLRSRIDALEAEQKRVHDSLTNARADRSLPSIMAGYNALQADQTVAEKIHERALIALQDARNEAAQQAIYLATFVHPALPQEAGYPIRWRLLLETAALSFVAWCLLQLIYHGIRDHID